MISLIKRNLFQALRGIAKRPFSSIVMIGSVSVGLALSTILFAFIDRENKTDTLYNNIKNIYRLLSSDPFEESGNMAYISNEVPSYLSNFPEIKATANVTELTKEGVTIEEGERLFEKSLVVGIDSSFFRLFDFPMFGNLLDNTLGKYEIILSSNYAGKIFGGSNPLGREVILAYDTISVALQVAGVLEPTTDNSHFQFDALVSLETFDHNIRGYSIYVYLNPGSSISDLEEKLSQDADMPSIVGPGGVDYFLQPLKEVYFDVDNIRPYTKGRNPLFIQVAWTVLIFTLFIALFNFINLFALQIIDRKKELAVKKIMGAVRTDLFLEITTEVFLYTSFGVIIAIGLVYILLPIFNNVLNTYLSLSYISNYSVLLVLFGIVLVLLLITALILLLFIDSAKALDLINDLSKWKFSVNKVFLVLQFVISMTLIMCASVIIQQTQYIKSKPLGFDREVIEVLSPTESTGDLKRMKDKLLRIVGFQKGSISLASGNPISGNQIVRLALNEDEFYMPFSINGDEDLLTTLGLHETSSFLQFPSSENDKIVNEKFVKHFNLEKPLGAIIPGSQNKIVGVVEDFNVASLKKEIPLYIIGYTDMADRVLINYKDNDLSAYLKHINAVWNEVYPDYYFEYSILQDELLKKHQADFFFTKIITFFSILSIVLSCFGLMALVQSNAQKMKREIAIRKTLGANIASIVKLLIIDFARWISLSFVFASFIGYFAIQYWLESFTYRISVGVSVFFITILTTVMIASIAIGTQTIKAAIANPVTRLRHE